MNGTLKDSSIGSEARETVYSSSAAMGYQIYELTTPRLEQFDQMMPPLKFNPTPSPTTFCPGVCEGLHVLTHVVKVEDLDSDD